MSGSVKLLLRETGALYHVLQLLQGYLPGAGPEAAVGVDLDTFRAEHARGIEYAVAHELGEFDEVRVDIYDTKAHLAVPCALRESAQDVVAGTVLCFSARLSGVAVGEL